MLHIFLVVLKFWFQVVSQWGASDTSVGVGYQGFPLWKDVILRRKGWLTALNGLVQGKIIWWGNHKSPRWIWQSPPNLPLNQFWETSATAQKDKGLGKGNLSPRMAELFFLSSQRIPVSEPLRWHHSSWWRVAWVLALLSAGHQSFHSQPWGLTDNSQRLKGTTWQDTRYSNPRKSRADTLVTGKSWREREGERELKVGTCKLGGKTSIMCCRIAIFWGHL